MQVLQQENVRHRVTHDIATKPLLAAPVAALAGTKSRRQMALCLCLIVAACESPVPPLSPTSFPDLMVDVRTAAEYSGRHIPGALSIPLDELASRIDELEPWKGKPVWTVCEVGIRAESGANLLLQHGFSQARSMGDLAAWDRAGGDVVSGAGAGSRTVFLDMRSHTDRWMQGVIPGALSIPAEHFAARRNELEQFREQKVVVLTGSEAATRQAVNILTNDGFERVSALPGGFDGWRGRGGATDGHVTFYFGYQQFLLEPALRGTGVGVRKRAIREDRTSTRLGLEIAVLFPGTLFEQAGLRLLDTIIAVDGRSLSRPDLTNVAALLRLGSARSHASYTIVRNSEELTIWAHASGSSSLQERTEAAARRFAKATSHPFGETISRLHASRSGPEVQPFIRAMEAWLQTLNSSMMPIAGHLLRQPLDVVKADRVASNHLQLIGEPRDIAKAALSQAAQELGVVSRAGLGTSQSLERMPLRQRLDGALRKQRASAQRALAQLSPEERAFLQEVHQDFSRVLLQRNATYASSAGPDMLSDLHRARSIAGKIHLAPLFESVGALVDVADAVLGGRFQPQSNRTKEDKDRPPGVVGPVVQSWQTEAGWVVIGSTAQNHYTGTFAIVVDLGGDDTYAWQSENAPTLVIDLAGNDRYQANDGDPAPALPHARLLYDHHGDDHYVGRIASALFGVELVVDRSGNDSYQSQSFSQGAAAFGAALLLDLDGDDTYTAERRSQGFASMMGYGLLLDVSGDDNYEATDELSFAQGAGVGHRDFHLGGVGVLVDGNGNDHYLGSEYVQGAGYFGGLGLLVDHGGNDTYQGKKFAQGAGVHVGTGVLIDRSGDDQYSASVRSQGAAWDLGVGFLGELTGDDRYTSKQTSQGYVAQGGFAVLADNAGTDRYVCDRSRANKCQGYVSANTYRPEMPRGIAMLHDRGKETDSLSRRNRLEDIPGMYLRVVE